MLRQLRLVIVKSLKHLFIKLGGKWLRHDGITASEATVKEKLKTKELNLLKYVFLYWWQLSQIIIIKKILKLLGTDKL